MEKIGLQPRIDGQKLLNDIEKEIAYEFSVSWNQETRDRVGEYQSIRSKDGDEVPFAMVNLDKTKWSVNKNKISNFFDLVPKRTREITISACYDVIENGIEIRKIRDINLVEEEWKGGRRIFITGGGKVEDKFGTSREWKYEKVLPQDCFTLANNITEVIKSIKKEDEKV